MTSSPHAADATGLTRLTWSRRGFVRDRCGVRGTVRWRGHQGFGSSDWTNLVALNGRCYSARESCWPKSTLPHGRARPRHCAAVHGGPAAALADVDKLSESLQGYHLFHATRPALLRDLDDYAEAALANTVALALTKNTGELSSKSGRGMSIEEASRSSEKLRARSTRPGFGISAGRASEMARPNRPGE